MVLPCCLHGDFLMLSRGFKKNQYENRPRMGGEAVAIYILSNRWWTGLDNRSRWRAGWDMLGTETMLILCSGAEGARVTAWRLTD